MSHDTPPKNMITSMFSKLADLCAIPFRPSQQRLTTQLFQHNCQTTVSLHSIHDGRSVGTDARSVLILTWWEAKKIQGTELYNIRSTVGASTKDLVWNDKKAISLPEAVAALKDLEALAITSGVHVAQKQPLAKYHWSKHANKLPQNVVKSSDSIRQPAPIR